MDELRSLWIFVQVVHHGSLRDAAVALDLTPAALSKSLGRLEQKLSVRLFNRSSRSLTLSDEGRRLFDGLEGSFGEIRSTLQGFELQRGEVAGTVRLSTVTGYGRTRVLPLLHGFFGRHPGVEIVMSIHDGARGLGRNAYDVRINWGEEREQSKIAHRLQRMELVLVASPGYLRDHGIPTEPGQLRAHHCITVSLPSQQRGRWHFMHRNGRSKPETILPKARLVIADELSAVVDAAVAGLGFSVISRDLIAGELQRGTLVPVLTQYRIEGSDPSQTEIIIQHPPRKHMSAATRALVDYLREGLA
jgi:DNA-binding transcriptional LysR family regulator